MKLLVQLIFFSSLILFCSSALKTYLKTNKVPKSDNSETPPTVPFTTYTDYGNAIKTLFTNADGLISQCNAKFSSLETPLTPKNPTVKLNTKVLQSQEDISINLPDPNPNEHSIIATKLGIDASALFFDYLDNAMLETILFEFNDIWDTVRSLKNVEYQPKYGVFRIKVEGKLKLRIKLDPKEAKPIVAKVRTINETTYETSVTPENLFAAFKTFNWNSRTDPSMAVDSFFEKYDFNGDGVLNPLEFFIGFVEINKNLLGNCRLCFNRTYLYFLNNMFEVLDCNGKRSITFDDLYEGLRKMQPIQVVQMERGSHEFKVNEKTSLMESDELSSGSKLRNNVYSCSDIVKGIRQFYYVPFSDFILKALPHNQKDKGSLTYEEFTSAILHGYINRLVFASGIEAKNLETTKEKRWNELNFCEKS